MSVCQVCEATTDGFCCRRCCFEVEKAIGDMPSLMHEASVAATRQTRVWRAGGAQRAAEPPTEPERHLPAWLRSRDGRMALRATPMLVDIDAADMVWVGWNTLTTWARHLAESRGVELPDPIVIPAVTRTHRSVAVRRNRWRITEEVVTRRPERRVQPDVVAWLLTNVEAIRWDELAGQVHDEITGLHRDLERLVDRSPSRIYAGPCSDETCKMDLYAPWRPSDADDEDRRDDKEFTCDGHRSDHDGCGAVYTWASRRPWISREIRGELVTLDALIDALPDLFPDLPVPPQASVRGWVRDGRLMDHGPNRVGELLYKGGELLDLIAAYKPKRFAPRRKRCA